MDNTEEIVKSLKENVEKMGNKDFSMFFFVMDTQGTPMASISNIYEHVKVLNNLGYRAFILHEKNDYTQKQLPFISSWLGDSYSELPHASIEDQSVKINATDFIFVPELFANIMEQTVKLPGKRVVMCQAYDYITETLQPGKGWYDYNIKDCITTTDNQKEYVDNLFNNRVKTQVVPVSIDDTFKKPSKPKKPIIAILTRDQRDTVKIFKTFYIKYPHLKWVSFRDMRGMTKDVFSKALAESCVSVWVDDISGFGTFPLESMKCGTPVIGKIPNLVNGWMNEKNGIWVDSINIIPDLLSQYIQAWLEDNDPSEIYENMELTVNQYTSEQQTQKISEVYGNLVNDRINEFNTTLEKYEKDNKIENVNE